MSGEITSDTPVGRKYIMKYLLDKIKHDHLLADARHFREDLPPTKVHSDFRADARADGEDVVIGGWLSQDGRSTKEAPWFSVRITRKAFPWIWCRGEPGRNIAALELLATLFCVVLFADSFKGSEIAITGLTDNKGNSYVIAKMFTTKLPGAAVLLFWAAKLVE